MSHRILIVGNCASGKTTLAKYFSKHLHIPHIELDAIAHLPGWESRSRESFASILDQQTQQNSWTICGNYESLVKDMLWRRASDVIWLDDNFPRTLLRLTARTWRRIQTKEELWNGNRESWSRTFSRESIFLWLLKSYSKRRRRLLPRMDSGEFNGLTRHHIRTNTEYRSLLARFDLPQMDWAIYKRRRL